MLFCSILIIQKSQKKFIEIYVKIIAISCRNAYYNILLELLLFWSRIFVMRSYTFSKLRNKGFTRLYTRNGQLFFLLTY